MEYIDNLYEEYLKTLKFIPMNDKGKLKENFKYWLEEKEKILPLYEKFLESYDLVPSKGIMEINKSNKDSLLPYTPYETRGFLVSKYVNTQKLNKKGIMNINGKIILIKNQLREQEVFVEFQKKLIKVSNIKNYITQFPIEDDTEKLMIELMMLDKNVFIGTYGKINDQNREENLQKLYNLKQKINKTTNKNIDGEVVYTKDYYLAAITPKLKYKIKNKK